MHIIISYCFDIPTRIQKLFINLSFGIFFEKTSRNSKKKKKKKRNNIPISFVAVYRRYRITRWLFFFSTRKSTTTRRYHPLDPFSVSVRLEIRIIKRISDGINYSADPKRLIVGLTGTRRRRREEHGERSEKKSWWRRPITSRVPARYFVLQRYFRDDRFFNVSHNRRSNSASIQHNIIYYHYVCIFILYYYVRANVYYIFILYRTSKVV